MTTHAHNSHEFKHIKHMGSRPKNDQDNHCREKLCHLVRDVGYFHEICAEKLYLINLASNCQEYEAAREFCRQHDDDESSPFIFWCFHDDLNLIYEPFNADFGPLNLALTHQFCSKLKVWFDTQSVRDPDKYVVVVLDDRDIKRKLNLTLLVAVAAMVLLDLTDQEVIQRLDFYMGYKTKPGEPKTELTFRERKKFSDVSGNQSLMSLTLEDCIKAFYAAIQHKFYDYYEFDQTEYLFYEAVLSGDLNWIIPGKILAFAGPTDKPINSKIYRKHPPRFYYHYFKDHNVTSIIRLNDPEYESSSFVSDGFDHFDLIFPDGYPPTSTIAAKFIKIIDEAKGAVAVHCYAGIGRTGTLIAAYLVARYNFTAQMAVAWTRICRPGSVIGEQQDWLFTKFDRFSVNKSLPKPAKTKRTKCKQTEPTSTVTELPKTQQMKPSETYAIAEKTYGQAKALLLAKMNREQHDRPCTRNSTLLKSLDEGCTTRASQAKAADIVLNLGKTIPLMLRGADFIDLNEGENPKYYRIEDGKYEWKVKFPEPDYVALRYDRKKDLNSGYSKGDIECCRREPKLEFKQELEVTPETLDNKANNGINKTVPKLKPIVYYSLFAYTD